MNIPAKETILVISLRCFESIFIRGSQFSSFAEGSLVHGFINSWFHTCHFIMQWKFFISFNIKFRGVKFSNLQRGRSPSEELLSGGDLP